MFLIDTNIFLEIFLDQAKKDICKEFLVDNNEQLHISDFSLHSIGVVLFKFNQELFFEKFIEDVLPIVKMKTLPIEMYKYLPEISHSLRLDFDDTYQYCVAKAYNLKIVTMDADFRKVKDVEVIFL